MNTKLNILPVQRYVKMTIGVFRPPPRNLSTGTVIPPKLYHHGNMLYR